MLNPRVNPPRGVGENYVFQPAARLWPASKQIKRKQRGSNEQRHEKQISDPSRHSYGLGQ
ncbi:hypothetical protein KAM436_39080 [Aquipseudomonas alcaligenes]|uniref:Uncharacterized protein n=1 Tax=Aquipseudomonas alcaligenes TaxID=43263 RepID=A0AA37FQG8_AQUAC|nr:hypothetical protein KAM430_39240 [Pseudomonas alcaligenes]GIZ86187.1 hypothetical protein KAM434_38820 [Pseudomonas alcaligenes]GIZ90569.1 hypothetical protein KAM435_38960 [Pseudomonas alcaligenes]GIZ94940.1 hypothetical protein KAM436_39080 [Pseudomonas alcaligenes]